MRINYQKYHDANERAIATQAIRDDLADRVKQARLDHSTVHGSVLRAMDFGLDRSTLLALGISGRDRSEFTRRLLTDPAELHHILEINGADVRHIVKNFMDSKNRVQRLEQRFAEVDAEYASASNLVRRMRDFIFAIDGEIPA